MEVARQRSRRMRASLLTAAAAAALLALVPGARAGESTAPAAKVLRVATSGDYAPFSSPDPAAQAVAGSGDVPPVGFDLDLAAAFARDAGYRVELVRFRWPDLARMLAAGDFDVAMSGVTIRADRSIAGRYTVPVAATQAFALTYKGSGVTSAVELDHAGRRLAVNAGGYLEGIARSTFHRTEIFPIPDNDAVRMAMLDRTFDAVLTDNFEARIWSASARDVVRIGPLSDDRKALLLPADRGELEAELDRWLLAKESDGTLARLRSRWFGGDAAAPGDLVATAAPLAALAAAVVERQALMPMVYDAKRAVGKPVEDRAQEEAVLEAASRTLAQAASAASVAAPDPEAGKAVFRVLIEIGKDAQQVLADRDARHRKGVVIHRDGAAGEAGAAANDAGAPAGAPAAGDAATGPAPGDDRAAGYGAAPAGAGTAAAVAGATSKDDEALPDPTVRRYDLAAELRPAISRISDKIARILLAIDAPVPASEARLRLLAELAGHDVKPERIGELADAVAAFSSRRGAAK